MERIGTMYLFSAFPKGFLQDKYHPGSTAQDQNYGPTFLQEIGRNFPDISHRHFYFVRKQTPFFQFLI
jgi:hypothetical protein